MNDEKWIWIVVLTVLTQWNWQLLMYKYRIGEKEFNELTEEEKFKKFTFERYNGGWQWMIIWFGWFWVFHISSRMGLI
jgi:hypothetical protein